MKDSVGRKLLQWRLKTVLPHVRGKLLDIGCGTNELVGSYEGEGVGVDVYPWENVDLVVENTAELPFKDASFDTVAIIAALNHIPNRDDVLREAHRVLRPNGRLLVTMIPPTISRIWHTLRKPWDADQSERGMIEGEVYGITPARMRELLKVAGFRVSHEVRFMLGLNRLTVAEPIAIASTTPTASIASASH
ncbi:MAG: methyltransferase domain-containing protein [Phycisphaerales bacterium]|nr:methyltransferase domain-containing protein [Phycisphaerales bacterium]